MSSRPKNISRTDQIDAFNVELDMLLNEKVISLSIQQRANISEYQQQVVMLIRDEHAEVSQAEKLLPSNDNSNSLATRGIMTAGAMVLSLTAIVFLYFNWWGLSTLIQVGILITTPIILIAATALVNDHYKLVSAVKLLTLVCFISFVSTFLMLSQIFNYTPSVHVLFVWSAFAFLLAYRFNHRILLVASILGIIFYSDVFWVGWNGIATRPENYFIVAAILIWVSTLRSLVNDKAYRLIFRVSGILTALVSILALANSGDKSYLLVNENIIEGSYQIIGLSLCACVAWLGVKSRKLALLNIGTASFIIFLYAKLYDWWWGHIPNYMFLFVVSCSFIVLFFVYRNIHNLHKSRMNVIAT